jgi:hypothetical protein
MGIPIVDVMVAECEGEQRDMEVGAGCVVGMDVGVWLVMRELCASSLGVAETSAAPPTWWRTM